MVGYSAVMKARKRAGSWAVARAAVLAHELAVSKADWSVGAMVCERVERMVFLSAEYLVAK